jgi:8-oxo-dGTP pyrophosphatase MutT (NUDIX family)
MTQQPPGWFAALADRLHTMTPSASGRAVTAPPPGVDPRLSAVLVLLGEGPAGPDVLLTQRADTLRSHPGQVAFPGGRIDEGDDGPIGAALREAAEETGLDPSGVTVAGVAPDLYVSPTNHLVTPVLAWWRRPCPVAPVDLGEVERVDRVPVRELGDPLNRVVLWHPAGYRGAAFTVRGMLVWGFTAGVLQAVLAAGGWERPWDDSRLLRLPDPVGQPSTQPSAPGQPSTPGQPSAQPSAPGQPSTLGPR